jgi:hypothetical protein
MRKLPDLLQQNLGEGLGAQASRSAQEEKL